MSHSSTYSLGRISDPQLLEQLSGLVASDRQNMATLLAYLGEVEARRLYLPAACSSMFTFARQVLGFSEDEACTRIAAARAARRCPEILVAVAAGHLHLSGAVLLARYLTDENASDLLTAAQGRSKRAIEALIAAT